MSPAEIIKIYALQAVDELTTPSVSSPAVIHNNKAELMQTIEHYMSQAAAAVLGTYLIKQANEVEQ